MQEILEENTVVSVKSSDIIIFLCYVFCFLALCLKCVDSSKRVFRKSIIEYKHSTLRNSSRLRYLFKQKRNQILRESEFIIENNSRSFYKRSHTKFPRIFINLISYQQLLLISR